VSVRAGIAIAGCRRSGDADAGDLYPDPDSELLRDSLVALGLAADLVSWDDPSVDWARRTATVIRSTWDSVDRPKEYISWVRQVGESSLLINPPEVVVWNLDKTYLVDLETEGVAVVPTQWLRAGREWEPPVGEFVIKPSISAGGRDTARYGRPHRAEARQHVARLVDRGQTVMVQPYLPSVVDPGEISLIFIDGRFSHAVRKGPVLTAGEGVRPRPWETMTFLGLAEPTLAQENAASFALAAVSRRFGQSLAYGRVDMLDDTDGNPLVLEVELIDPNLSFPLFPQAANILAMAIAEQAGNGRDPLGDRHVQRWPFGREPRSHARDRSTAISGKSSGEP
jgi:hypothetical protein